MKRPLARLLHTLILFFIAPLLIPFASSAQDDSELLIGQMMCTRPQTYFWDKVRIKKEFNGIVKASLNHEGVGSLAELAKKASKTGLQYYTRSMLNDAIFFAALTENRSALADLTLVETHLCRKPMDGFAGWLGKRQSKGDAGCERLLSALNNPDSFIKNAKKQYSYIQDEKNRHQNIKGSVKPKSLEEIKENIQGMDFLPGPRTEEMMKDYKNSNRYVLNTGEFASDAESAALNKKGLKDYRQKCSEKIPDGLMDDVANYNPEGNLQDMRGQKFDPYAPSDARSKALGEIKRSPPTSAVGPGRQ